MGQKTETRMHQAPSHPIPSPIPSALHRAEKLTSPIKAKELYDVVMKGVADAQADITEFTKAMREEESKAIFARAVKSQQEASTDIKPWRHKDHPGWYDGTHQS